MKLWKGKMRVSALVNDTVGTPAGARYWDDDVMVAIVLGTGTNACYVECVDPIPKLKNHNSSSGRTIINTEWGSFSNGIPLTQFDRDMDAASINPGEQIFEKTIAGMYLGEITSRVLLKMAESSDLFGESNLEKLSTQFALRTPDVCAMQQDNSQDLEVVEKILYNVAGVVGNADEGIFLHFSCMKFSRIMRGWKCGLRDIFTSVAENKYALVF